MKIAFAYIRRSSYKQLDNNSVEIQKQHIQEFAKRNHLVVPEEFIFIEEATSAYSKSAKQRKQLMLLKEKMIELNISIVIFHDVSRMDRTGYSFTTEFYQPLLDYLPNLQVYTTHSNEPVNPDSLDMKIKFLLFQHESEIKSERALSNLKAELQKENPVRPGATVPYGYKQVNKKLIPNQNAEIVSFISFLYTWGHSFKNIALLLNEARIPSPTGKLWPPSTVEKILGNSVYTGNLTWHVRKGKSEQETFTFKESHEPLMNQFELQLHSYNKQLQKEFGRLNTHFLFLNKIRCRHCQQPMINQNGSTKHNGVTYHYHYYVCENCSYKVAIKEVHKHLVPLVFKHIQRLALSKENKKMTLATLSKIKVSLKGVIEEAKNMAHVLSKKLEQAQTLKERELELHIVDMIVHNETLASTYQQKLTALESYYLAVESDHFFTRFDNVLEHYLQPLEQRLMILYFVDFILVSTNQKPVVQYKDNIFDFLENSKEKSNP
ncbi:recombinase family protein [Bacillus sp. 1780r2a1]|nr:recombinase family protein [Bacillus sp. 1780r2a1]